MNIYEKIASLLDAANGCTGAEDEDLTSAIRTLIAGYVDNSLVLDDVVEWYKTEVSDAYRYVKSLGGGYVHHLCVADMHYNVNFRHSANIVKALQATGRFGKVFLLGDNMDGEGVSDQITNLTADFGDLNGQICILTGNHDGGVTSRSTFYSMMSEDEDVVWGDTTWLYYYMDDDTHKIRYIILNGRTGTAAAKAQTSWFQNLVNTLPEGYGIIGFCHYAFTDCYDENGNVRSATDGTTINASYKTALYMKRLVDPLSVIGLVHGHYHLPDLTNWVGLHQFGLCTDAGTGKVSTKVPETTTEQSIAIISVNTRTHDIRIKVIGWVPVEYYRAANFDYSEESNTWLIGYYIMSSGGLGTDANCAVWPNLVQVPVGNNLWLWDDRFVNHWSHWAWYKDGVYTGRNTYTSTNHTRGVWRIERGRSDTNADGVNFDVGDVYSDDPERFDHIHWSTEAPIFTDWNDIVWLKDYCINNSNYTQNTGYAVLDKMISVRPGQTVTFSVDDENWTTNRIYFYFHSVPETKYFAGTRVGVTNGQKTYSYVVPAGKYYLLIDAQNLADYTDKAVVTITDPS